MIASRKVVEKKQMSQSEEFTKSITLETPIGPAIFEQLTRDEAKKQGYGKLPDDYIVLHQLKFGDQKPDYYILHVPKDGSACLFSVRGANWKRDMQELEKTEAENKQRSENHQELLPVKDPLEHKCWCHGEKNPNGNKGTHLDAICQTVQRVEMQNVRREGIRTGLEADVLHKWAVFVGVWNTALEAPSSKEGKRLEESIFWLCQQLFLEFIEKQTALDPRVRQLIKNLVEKFQHETPSPQPPGVKLVRKLVVQAGEDNLKLVANFFTGEQYVSYSIDASTVEGRHVLTFCIQSGGGDPNQPEIPIYQQNIEDSSAKGYVSIIVNFLQQAFHARLPPPSGIVSDGYLAQVNACDYRHTDCFMRSEIFLQLLTEGRLKWGGDLFKLFHGDCGCHLTSNSYKILVKSKERGNAWLKAQTEAVTDFSRNVKIASMKTPQCIDTRWLYIYKILEFIFGDRARFEEIERAAGQVPREWYELMRILHPLDACIKLLSKANQSIAFAYPIYRQVIGQLMELELDEQLSEGARGAAVALRKEFYTRTLGSKERDKYLTSFLCSPLGRMKYIENALAEYPDDWQKLIDTFPVLPAFAIPSPGPITPGRNLWQPGVEVRPAQQPQNNAPSERPNMNIVGMFGEGAYTRIPAAQLRANNQMAARRAREADQTADQQDENAQPDGANPQEEADPHRLNELDEAAQPEPIGAVRPGDQGFKRGYVSPLDDANRPKKPKALEEIQSFQNWDDADPFRDSAEAFFTEVSHWWGHPRLGEKRILSTASDLLNALHDCALFNSVRRAYDVANLKGLHKHWENVKRNNPQGSPPYEVADTVLRLNHCVCAEVACERSIHLTRLVRTEFRTNAAPDLEDSRQILLATRNIDLGT